VAATGRFWDESKRSDWPSAVVQFSIPPRNGGAAGGAADCPTMGFGPGCGACVWPCSPLLSTPRIRAFETALMTTLRPHDFFVDERDELGKTLRGGK